MMATQPLEHFNEPSYYAFMKMRAINSFFVVQQKANKQIRPFNRCSVHNSLN